MRLASSPLLAQAKRTSTTLLPRRTVASVPADEPVVNTIGDPDKDLSFTPVAPCRILDTRLAGGPLAPGAPRSFVVAGTAGFGAQGGREGGCGIPAGAAAVEMNFVVVSPTLRAKREEAFQE